MPKVLICVPTYENITPDTFKALWDMDKPCECDFEFVRGYDVATARNNCVKLFMAGPYTHLMMVDNDVTPPKDALTNLLSHHKMVVSGYYAHRDKDNVYSGRTCVCKRFKDDSTPFFGYPLESEYTGDEIAAMDGLTEIHGGGMGCILIDIAAIVKLQYPYFAWVNYAMGGSLSEDLYFCEKLHAEDIPIYVDPRVACGHMLRHIQMPT